MTPAQCQEKALEARESDSANIKLLKDCLKNKIINKSEYNLFIKTLSSRNSSSIHIHTQDVEDKTFYVLSYAVSGSIDKK